MTNQKYNTNLEQYKKAMKFENDYVLGAYAGPTPPAAFSNMTIADYINNTKEGFKAYMSYLNALNNQAPIQVVNTPYPGKFNVLISMMWLSNVKTPGRELPPNSLWQVNEKVVHKDEDYDFLIKNGYDAYKEMMLPKVIEMSEVQSYFEYAQAEGLNEAMAHIENGFPLVNSMAIAPPFEVLSGSRTMSKFFMDCYKKFDLVKEAQDLMLPNIIESSLAIMKQSNAIGAWIGGWRGASGMVSPKIWDNLVWPYMKKISEALLANNYIPIFHLDQNWDRDIERFLELPKQSFILNTDGMTDLKRARKLLGDHCAFMGDVPAPLLSTARADKVKDYVNSLLDSVGSKGMIITSGCDSPANAKFENMVAMYRTAADYK